MDGPRSTVAGASLVVALVAVALSLLTLLAPAQPAPAPVPVPASIDLSMVITGSGAIGGPAVNHLFDPQMLVARRGDTLRLRVMNQSHFRHGIEVVGYGIRTGELTGGEHAADVLTFTATKPGIFEYRCYLPYDPATGTCAPDHDKMVGHLIVIEPGRQ